ncbi:MAG TPA: WcbI family polysaccharide biosynthesis putative acetyltransferase [Rhizomicrobium sp.]|jgi:hypothetical protein
MKVLVVTNCATAAYTEGLRALFPEWDVKGADLAATRKFIRERNQAFLDHMASSAMLVASLPDDPMFDTFAADGTKLFIPNFLFRAYHPDSFYLHTGGAASHAMDDGTDTPTAREGGRRQARLHSRITVTAFLLGMSAEETAAAFNGRTYEKIGYFSVFESERDKLLGRFGQAGIDLAPELERWTESGDFLYTFNHPKAVVFSDILLKALTGRFIAPAGIAAAGETLAQVPDFLAGSPRWPVYPEIAARLGFEGSLLWRTGRGAGGRSLPLAEFIAESFASLSGAAGFTADDVPGFADCAAALRS